MPDTKSTEPATTAKSTKPTVGDDFRGIRPRKSVIDNIQKAFSRKDLKRICEMSEYDFAAAYDMETVMVAQRAPDNFYAFRDNGSDVLAVAHLDTVGMAWERECNFIDTQAGPVVYSRALDDRLGAYIILELLPALGIQYDILLTVGEEKGLSTAGYFEESKQYNYAIEFDRGGTDVVMYQYEDDVTRDLVKAAGARVGDGSFSDISYLEHLDVKCFNWGVGYRDYHSARAHAYLDDTFSMVGKYLKFHEANADLPMPHLRSSRRNWWDDEEGERECDRIFGLHNHDEDDCARVIEDLIDDGSLLTERGKW